MDRSASDQQKIYYQGALLKGDGSLSQVGWSPHPNLDCNLEKARFYRFKLLQPLRIKRWDYYGIYTPDHYFSFTIANVGYMGMIFCYVIDMANKTHEEQTIITPLGKGAELARNSTKGTSAYSSRKMKLTFETLPGRRRIVCQWDSFGKGKSGLSADINLALNPNHESVNIVIPIEGNRFYYNRKINCMPASGVIEYAGKQHQLDEASCLGSLDWGRGVWALESSWVWASANGFLPDGQTVGLNLGYGFGDASKATENALIVNGKLHKLADVRFRFDPENYQKPWLMRSSNGRLHLTFEPFFERVAKTDIKVLHSQVHQVFGHYNGYAVTDEGKTIEINELPGFAEEHHARW